MSKEANKTQKSTATQEVNEFSKFLLDFTMKHIAPSPWRMLVPELDQKFKKKGYDLSKLGIKELQEIFPILEDEVSAMIENMFPDAQDFEERCDEANHNLEKICQFYAGRSRLTFLYEKKKDASCNIEIMRLVCKNLEQEAKILKESSKSLNLSILSKIENTSKAFQFLHPSFVEMTANIFHYESLKKWSYFTQGINEILSDKGHSKENILYWCFDNTFQNILAIADWDSEESDNEYEEFSEEDDFEENSQQ